MRKDRRLCCGGAACAGEDEGPFAESLNDSFLKFFDLFPCVFSAGAGVALAVMFGLAVLTGLFLLDALALIRMGSSWVGDSGLDLGAELRRMMSGNEEILFLMLFNAGVFVPFGPFLSGFFLLTGKGKWRSLWMATLAGLGLSLLIESLQLVFHIGIFELTDLLLNTLGTFVGAALPLGGRFLDAISLKFLRGGGIMG